MKKIVDARGLSCPQPVILTKKALGESEVVTTIVDNVAAKENVTRLARSSGFAVEISENSEGIFLTLRREGTNVDTAASEESCNCLPQTTTSSATSSGPTIVFVPADCLGRGPTELGERLMGVFFHTLLEVNPKPQKIIFMNTGVKLTVEGARPLEDLRALAAQGVEILACGACLSFFELTDKLAVGKISNMYDIATALMEAGKIVEL